MTKMGVDVLYVYMQYMYGFVYVCVPGLSFSSPPPGGAVQMTAHSLSSACPS